MNQYKRAGIVACSNGVAECYRYEMEQLKRILVEQGIEPKFSHYIYAKDGVKSGTAKQRAHALMEFYRDPEIDVIFDVSGGDIANEILPYLDFDVLADARNVAGNVKEFWGYSDLTVLLNAIYAKTGNAGVLYQVRHLSNVLRDEKNVADGHTKIVSEKLFAADYHFLRGTQLSGIVVGGNIRCLLKLAGTEYFPDMTDKILFWEARSGLEPQMRTYLSQLHSIGVFEKISGVYLGTFTQWEKEWKEKAPNTQAIMMEQLVKEYVPAHIPIAKTYDIGHAVDSKALYIGKAIHLFEKK